MGYDNIVKGLMWLALIVSDKLDKPPHDKSYTFNTHSIHLLPTPSKSPLSIPWEFTEGLHSIGMPLSAGFYPLIAHACKGPSHIPINVVTSLL